MSMEFTIPARAKKITLSLIVVGAALAAVGVATNYEDHQFTTRLLTNGLINAFFFFAIALGALFFLALQYATDKHFNGDYFKLYEHLSKGNKQKFILNPYKHSISFQYVKGGIRNRNYQEFERIVKF